MKKLVARLPFSLRVERKAKVNDLQPKGTIRTIVPRAFLERFPHWEGAEHPEKFPNQIII